MKLTPEQKSQLLAKCELIANDAAYVEDRIDSSSNDARALGEVADKIVDWATQLSELLYQIECQEDDIQTGN